MARENRRKRPEAGEPWLRIALADPVTVAILVLGIVGYAVYSLPLITDEAGRELFSRLWDLPLILLCGFAFLRAARRPRASGAERRFWRLWAGGIACWLAVYALDIGTPLALREGPGFQLLRDLVYLGLFLGPALAVTQRPDLARGDVRRSFSGAIEATGIVVLVFALFVYFALIPLILTPQGFWSTASQSELFLALDFYLVWRLVRQRQQASPAWRAPLGALAIALALWAAADAAQSLQRVGLVSDALLSVILDLLWLWPFVGFALAPCLRRERSSGVALAEPPPPAGLRIDRPRSSLLLQAMFLPVVHLALENFDALSPATVAMQRLCAVAAAALLLALALLERRRLVETLRATAGLLERRNAELQTLVTELAVARDQAEAGSRAKSQFLANTSHEIRTPVHGVLGMAELLLQTDLGAAQQRLAATLQRSAQALLELIDDVLDLSRIEAGRLELASVALDPREVAEEAVAMVGPRARAKGLAISCRIEEPLLLRLLGDAGRLRQILLNLLDNAVKFTDHGEVTLVVRGRELEERAVSLVFEVQDTGVGIPPGGAVQVFDSFTQLDGGPNRRQGGAGLGLAISRQLARLMGGEIELESQVGVGSTFRFQVRLARAAGDSAPAARAGALPKTGHAAAPQVPQRFAGRVLVAEDDPVNQAVMAAFLSDFGLEVELVEDGEAALATLSRSRFDLVLMDCMMPGIDGYAATAELRRSEGSAPRGSRRTPVAGVTASAMAGDRERCLSAGMDDYLSKPFRREDLRALVERWLPAHAGGTPALADWGSAASAAGRVGLDDAPPALDGGTLENLRRLTPAGPELLVTLFGLYRLNVPKQIGELSAARDRADFLAQRRIVHALKSSSANIGALRLAELCRGAEECLRESSPTPPAPAIDAIAREYERVDRAIDQILLEVVR